MLSKTLALGLALCTICAAHLSAKDYDISSFGAVPDGITLNTASIQAAIDYASANGGGRVVFKPGNYVSGSIYLKTGVTLHLEKDATILGSINPWDYIFDPVIRWTALVFARDQKNIGITGEGTIDGRGFEVATRCVDYVHLGLIPDPLQLDRIKEDKRPENIHFLRCEDITISGITLKNPASWNQQYDRCRGLLVDGVTVDAKA